MQMNITVSLCLSVANKMYPSGHTSFLHSFSFPLDVFWYFIIPFATANSKFLHASKTEPAFFQNANSLLFWAFRSAEREWKRVRKEIWRISVQLQMRPS